MYIYIIKCFIAVYLHRNSCQNFRYHRQNRGLVVHHKPKHTNETSKKFTPTLRGNLTPPHLPTQKKHLQNRHMSLLLTK